MCKTINIYNPLFIFLNMQTDPNIKENILRLIKQKGPSLPVPLSRELYQSSLFVSAFLSELVSERKLKMSSMRVGNSPLYFVPGQKPMLAKFFNYLNNKEKEAFNLLKEKNGFIF